MVQGSNKDAWIREIRLDIKPPSLKDNTADVDRILKALEKELKDDSVSIDFSLIQEIPTFLGRYGYDMWAVIYKDQNTWQVMDILPPEKEGPLYGLAMDLGSATIVIRLIDLTDGQKVEEVSFINPQIEIGPDILTRIHFAQEEKGLEKCQSLLLRGINENIKLLSKKGEIDPRQIMGMSMAGNTTMTHLFLGLNPYGLCREPYIPVINKPALIEAKTLQLNINPRAPLLIFPNVGSYFGGDLIAGILALGMTNKKDVSILIDVGTNAEVVLGNREWLMACAGAAGPALEGGVASMGMMAGPGVIDKIAIDPQSQTFRVTTIGDNPPLGICGSGLIDLVAQLFLAGMIDIRGRFVPDRCAERLKTVEGLNQLIVVPSKESANGEDLTISQSDIDTLLRSKAAMYTILTTITQMIHLSPKDIRHFYISGTFGSFINPESAITIGMMPDLPLETYEPVGNTSLSGAELALLSEKARREIYMIRDRVTYIELNVNQDFMNLFNAARFIPHTDRALFPSVKEQYR